MRQNVSVHCIDATYTITYLLDPTWCFKKIRRYANPNKNYDAIVVPRKNYFTLPSLWMPLQAGEIWDNTAKQCLGAEHNGGFADDILVQSANSTLLTAMRSNDEWKHPSFPLYEFWESIKKLSKYLRLQQVTLVWIFRINDQSLGHYHQTDGGRTVKLWTKITWDHPDLSMLRTWPNT